MPDPEFGKITDEKLASLRQRIGLDLDSGNFEPVDTELERTWSPSFSGFNQEVTPDGVRHFVNGYGDDNPLYCNESYGKSSSWGSLIAPPTFVWSMYLPPEDGDITLGGGDEPPRKLKESVRQLFEGDPIRGTGALQSNLQYEFYRPLRPSDRIFMKRSLLSVVEKESSWGGRAVHVTWGLVSWNQNKEIVHLQRGTWVRAERKQVVSGKELQPAPEPYTQGQLDEIDEAYCAERRQGSQPRWFEDVEVGEELQPRVKGPLRITDVILWHAGFGQAFPTRAFRLGYETRKRSPGLYTPNSLNVPDIVQRMHWDVEWAKKVGAVERYDYGALRETWLCQLLTDWAGDQAWIRKLDVQHRKFNYVGDTTWLKGRVVSKDRSELFSEVGIELWCENQRGMITSPAKAVVVLPSKETGGPELPRPSESDPLDLLRSEIHRLASNPEDREDG